MLMHWAFTPFLTAMTACTLPPAVAAADAARPLQQPRALLSARRAAGGLRRLFQSFRDSDTATMMSMMSAQGEN